MARRSVVVVGGGISGLAVAHHLTRATEPPEVTLLEAGPRVGGWIDTVDLGAEAGRPTGQVDIGPDSMLVRDPRVRELLDQLGLAGQARPPAGTGAFVWTRAGLRRLPRSSVFGVPDSPWRLLRSGLVSPVGMFRAAADLILPRTRLGPDPSIADLLRPRLGGPVFATLVEPMLGGVHAGRAERLSARSAVPEVFAVAARHRSVIRAVRGLGPRTGAGPALASFPGGMSRLPRALAEAVTAAGGLIRTSAGVTALDRAGGGYRVRAGDGREVVADAVVLALPAWAAAPLIGGLAPGAAGAAAAIDYASVATATLALHPDAVAGMPAGTGFLVPPAEGRLLVGCTWLSAKWPRPGAAPGDAVVVRGMVGRDGDDRWTALDDAALVAAVLAELGEALGRPRPSRTAVLARRVRRMPRALPQYTIGHAERVRAVEAGLAEAAPGVLVTGAGYRGLGIAACLLDAERVAAQVVSSVRLTR